jgi:hypothetical protein
LSGIPEEEGSREAGGRVAVVEGEANIIASDHQPMEQAEDVPEDARDDAQEGMTEAEVMQAIAYAESIGISPNEMSDELIECLMCFLSSELPPSWVEYQTNEGVIYYSNGVQSSWTRPDESLLFDQIPLQGIPGSKLWLYKQGFAENQEEIQEQPDMSWLLTERPHSNKISSIGEYLEWVNFFDLKPSQTAHFSFIVKFASSKSNDSIDSIFYQLITPHTVRHDRRSQHAVAIGQIASPTYWNCLTKEQLITDSLEKADQKEINFNFDFSFVSQINADSTFYDSSTLQSLTDTELDRCLEFFSALHESAGFELVRSLTEKNELTSQ